MKLGVQACGELSELEVDELGAPVEAGQSDAHQQAPIDGPSQHRGHRQPLDGEFLTAAQPLDEEEGHNIVDAVPEVGHQLPGAVEHHAADFAQAVNALGTEGDEHQRKDEER